MRTETITTIRAIVDADSDATPEQRDAVLRACSRKQSHRRMGTKRDAAAILGIHPETVKPSQTYLKFSD